MMSLRAGATWYRHADMMGFPFTQGLLNNEVDWFLPTGMEVSTITSSLIDEKVHAPILYSCDENALWNQRNATYVN